MSNEPSEYPPAVRRLLEAALRLEPGLVGGDLEAAIYQYRESLKPPPAFSAFLKRDPTVWLKAEGFVGAGFFGPLMAAAPEDFHSNEVWVCEVTPIGRVADPQAKESA